MALLRRNYQDSPRQTQFELKPISDRKNVMRAFKRAPDPHSRERITGNMGGPARHRGRQFPASRPMGPTVPARGPN